MPSCAPQERNPDIPWWQPSSLCNFFCEFQLVLRQNKSRWNPETTHVRAEHSRFISCSWKWVYRQHICTQHPRSGFGEALQDQNVGLWWVFHLQKSWIRHHSKFSGFLSATARRSLLQASCCLHKGKSLDQWKYYFSHLCHSLGNTGMSFINPSNMVFPTSNWGQRNEKFLERPTNRANGWILRKV